MPDSDKTPTGSHIDGNVGDSMLPWPTHLTTPSKHPHRMTQQAESANRGLRFTAMPDSENIRPLTG